MRPASWRSGDITRQVESLRFGPRWESLRRAGFGDGEALAQLCLPREFASDVESYQLHPALMDIATGFGLRLLDGYEACQDGFAPMAYKRLRVWDYLPDEIYSHVRLAQHASAQDSVVTFDATITDSSGNVLVEIEEFSMKRLAAAEFLTAVTLDSAADREPSRHEAQMPPLVALAENEGILPEEGVAALNRALANPTLAQVVVSSLDIEALGRFIAKGPSDAGADAAGSEMGRPELSSAYLAPRDDVESTLAQSWRELLGVSQVGIQDDFFDLGGHSLIALRFIKGVKQAYGIELPLATMFEASTIERLAAILRRQLRLPEPGEAATSTGGPEADEAQSSWSCLVPIQPNGSRPPLFFVHGMSGNILNFRDLARRLGADQPVYGLQAFGLNGVDRPHTTIEEMAAHYLEEVRKVDPNGPYFMGGFSGGGTIAFEMARQLKSAGREVGLVVFLDTWSPPYINKTKLDRILGVLKGVRSEGLAFVRRWTRRKTERILNRVLRRWPAPEEWAPAEEIGGGNIDTSPFFIAAESAYDLRPLDQRVIMLRAMLRGEDGYVPPDFGWTPYVQGRFDILYVPGWHEGMMVDPNVRVTARYLRAAMDDVIQGSASAAR
jgi:thioesterase domain-containing protein/acyl carrier protein